MIHEGEPSPTLSDSLRTGQTDDRHRNWILDIHFPEKMQGIQRPYDYKDTDISVRGEAPTSDEEQAINRRVGGTGRS